MPQHSRIALLPALAVVLLLVGPKASSQTPDAGPSNIQTEKKQPDTRKEEPPKEARRAVTLTVKVSGAGSAVADASVLVTNERSYDTTRSTNSDGVATFSGVPRDHVEIIVTAKGWKNLHKDLESSEIGAGAEVTVPILLTK